MVCLFYTGIAIVAALYALFDVNYFIRFVFMMIWGKFVPKKRKRLTEDVHSYGFSTTNDVDFFITHMNNARFIRELDFARLDYYHRTGLYDAVISKGATVLQAATTARYRRTMPIFTFFRVATRLVYWDEKAFYLEHKFITLSDNFIRAIFISKQQLTGIEIGTSEIINLVDPDLQVPEAPEDLKLWIKYNEASSKKLRKSD
ncbi:protein THEM6-like isoform X2 [Athalia rosae]|nr:protein THEM6-like isoform X2 [Athalia rosae]XP_048512278.1 protein THEM6-like isoform X2 [Athalia rosae]XP_048512279.1 protein THEM6-like isoform X2 [Athalia rosae]